MSMPAEDQRSVAELFQAALHSENEEMGCGAIKALHWRGSREVFERAAELCRSGVADERALGADVLGQLGVPERTYPDECFGAVLPLLADGDADVLACAIIALQHLDRGQALAHVLPFRLHPEAHVRFAVTHALCGVDDEQAIKALLSLSEDQDDDVRNWATFGLGQQSDRDTPQIRAALEARLDDRDEDVRDEAVIGLARRGDARMAAALEAILENDPNDFLAQHAAELLHSHLSGR
jgi:HEAT repeat protein